MHGPSFGPKSSSRGPVSAGPATRWRERQRQAGDLAVLRASYEETLTPKDEGEPMDLTGSWLIVLRKQSDGSWQLWRNMWSVVAPPAPPGQ